MTHEKKDKKNKNCSSIKDEFIFLEDPQNYDATAYLSKSQEKCYSLT